MGGSFAVESLAELAVPVVAGVDDAAPVTVCGVDETA
jgi:hypothetical protein